MKAYFFDETERPVVAFDTGLALGYEQFQGTVMRPLLKQQNIVLLLLLKEFLTKKFPLFSKAGVRQQKEIIDKAVKFNVGFRKKLLQLFLQNLGREERIVFEAGRKEYSRRLTQLWIERFTSQLDALSET